MYYHGLEPNSESENRCSTRLRDLSLELLDQVLYSIAAGRLGGNSGGRESVLQDHSKFREYSPPGFVCRNRGCRYDTLNCLGRVRFVGRRLTGTLIGVLPIPFLVMIIAYLVCYGILNRSVYGRCLRAVGSSEIAARTAGLPVDLIRILAFAIVGGCTALAGVFLTAELSSASAIMATGYELTVIAVVVIGGTSLKGGEGTLFGSFTGALFFAVISSALNILNVAAYWQYVVTGVFLISALGVQALRSYILVE